jgi:hypothetical protein
LHGQRRNAVGGGLSEGAASLVMITLVILLCVFLVFGAGAASYYKYKLGCVTDRTAEYLADLYYWNGAANPNFSGGSLPARAQELSSKLLTDYGLPPAITTDAYVSGQLLTVQVIVPGLQLLQGSSIFPVSLTLSDKAVVPIPLSEPPGVMAVTDGTLTVNVPVYGMNVPPYSNQGPPGTGAPAGTAIFYPRPVSIFQADYGLPPGTTFSKTP